MYKTDSTPTEPAGPNHATARANTYMGTIHNRMPAILAANDVPARLGETEATLDDAAERGSRWCRSIPAWGT
jgi:hypothetical protein